MVTVKSSLGALTLGGVGHCVWRHWHQPTVCVQRSLQWPHALALSPENVLATLSALLWAVFIIVSIKVRVDCAEVRQ